MQYTCKIWREKKQWQTQTTMDRQCKWGLRISWTDIEWSNELDEGPRTMEVIHSYPSPPNSWRQELMMVMTMMMRVYIHACINIWVMTMCNSACIMYTSRVRVYEYVHLLHVHVCMCRSMLVCIFLCMYFCWCFDYTVHASECLRACACVRLLACVCLRASECPSVRLFGCRLLGMRLHFWSVRSLCQVKVRIRFWRSVWPSLTPGHSSRPVLSLLLLLLILMLRLLTKEFLDWLLMLQ